MQGYVLNGSSLQKRGGFKLVRCWRSKCVH